MRKLPIFLTLNVVLGVAGARSAPTTKILLDFSGGAAGGQPVGTLIFGTDGAIYGTTLSGGRRSAACGKEGCGVVYRFDPATGLQTVLHCFDGTDGAGPQNGLTVGSDGLLYGTTQSGGKANDGVAFRLDPARGKYTRLHDFGSGMDGSRPSGSIAFASDGLLYGTTVYGGASNMGVLYRIRPNNAVEEVVHDFAGADGEYPYGGVTSVGRDTIYGTTQVGGPAQYGNLYVFTPSSLRITTVADFAPYTAALYPKAPLVADESGVLYSFNEYGNIYSVDPSTQVVAGVASGSNGYGMGSLTIDDQGGLYATPFSPKVSDCKAIRVDLTSQDVTVLHRFAGHMDGQYPGGLTWHAGALYGTTAKGGTFGHGTLFVITP